MNKTVNASTVTPNVCNSILTDCGTASTTTSTTTIQTLQTSTQVVDTTPTCNIINPYSYPYTLNGCTPTFMLPNGATTSDGTVKIYNTIAKNLNTWITNSSTSGNDSVYIKYYPSSMYELDNRNVITINIPFNGKTIGTYRYSPGTTLPPEISFNSLNYQGSPVVITDQTGTSTEIIKSTPWGVQTTNSFIKDAVLPTEFGYTGHKYDSDSSLTYAHARYYDATQRIWKSEDPMVIDGFTNQIWLMNPQYQNGYSYALNNPSNNVDPDGKEPVEAAFGIAILSLIVIGHGLMVYGAYTDDIQMAEMGFVVNDVPSSLGIGGREETMNEVIAKACFPKGVRYSPDYMSGLQNETYRGDGRSPSEIKASGGFNSKGQDIDMGRHADYESLNGSAYVSTSLKVSEANKFALGKTKPGSDKTYVYKISLEGLTAFDVNKTLPTNNFSNEKEVAVFKKIPTINIIGVKEYNYKSKTWSDWLKF